MSQYVIEFCIDSVKSFTASFTIIDFREKLQHKEKFWKRT